MTQRIVLKIEMEDYVETEISQRMRETLTGLVGSREIHPESIEGREISHLKFDKYSRKNFDEGHITLGRIVEALIRADNARYSLAKIVVKFGFCEEQVDEILRDYFNNLYGPKSILEFEKGTKNEEIILRNGRDSARRRYKEDCIHFGIEPDINFPDWKEQ